MDGGRYPFRIVHTIHNVQILRTVEISGNYHVSIPLTLVFGMFDDEVTDIPIVLCCDWMCDSLSLRVQRIPSVVVPLLPLNLSVLVVSCNLFRTQVIGLIDILFQHVLQSQFQRTGLRESESTHRLCRDHE